MGEVIAHLAMSPDGFTADPDDGCDELSGFYGSGDVAVKPSEGFPELHVSQATVGLLTAEVAKAAATAAGRRLYDITNAVAVNVCPICGMPDRGSGPAGR
jgi:hypothetical protein